LVQSVEFNITTLYTCHGDTIAARTVGSSNPLPAQRLALLTIIKAKQHHPSLSGGVIANRAEPQA
jgi:hypothetical protein